MKQLLLVFFHGFVEPYQNQNEAHQNERDGCVLPNAEPQSGGSGENIQQAYKNFSKCLATCDGSGPPNKRLIADEKLKQMEEVYKGILPP